MTITHRSLLLVVGLLAAASLVGIAALWPPSEEVDEHVDAEPDAAPAELLDATIREVEPVGDVDDPGLPPGARSVVIIAELEETGELEVFPMVDDTGDLYQPGDRVLLERFEPLEPGDDPTFAISDFRRGPHLMVLAVLFVLAVLAFSRLQGARALIGLVFTFAVILVFIVPALLAGRSPLLVALAGSVLIMIATLYLSHGFNRKTTAAVVGTAAALAVTVALGTLFVDVASLTGFTDEEARFANVRLGGISLQGLLLAGIIVGALGVLDDVTMSQSATVFALNRADPRTGFGGLVTGALSVGRDHVAATVNTLFLAYAGASLPLLILFVTGPIGFYEAITSELVAVEVVRTLVGSLGLIAAVPLTTLLAAALVVSDPATDEEGDGHGHVAAPHGGHAASAAAPSSATEDEPDDDRAAAVDEHAGMAHAADRTESPASPPPEPPTDQGQDAAQPPADGDDPEWELRLRQAYGLDTDEDDDGPR